MTNEALTYEIKRYFGDKIIDEDLTELVPLLQKYLMFENDFENRFQDIVDLRIIVEDYLSKAVDLRTCKRGDILVSKHGLELTYINPLPEHDYFDHEVKYPDGSYGSRTHRGFCYRKRKLDTDHDIVKIIHK